MEGQWIKENMEHKYQENYHVYRNGKMDPFCYLLNCYDQICYFRFRKVSHFNRWIYFCDDINLEIKADSIFVGKTMVNKEYQKVEKWNITEKHFKRIHELLKEKDTLMLRTAFNYVPNYAWWDEGQDHLHTSHLTYVIGEDDDVYYVVDSPWVFLDIKTIRMEGNPSIVKIVKGNFNEAFQKSCEAFAIEFENLPDKKSEEFPFLKRVLEKIVQNYYFDKNTVITGRNAIGYLAEKCSLQEEKIFDASFMYHLMVARRLLLKRGISICSRYINNYDTLVDCLDKSIEYWTQFKSLSDEHLYKGVDVYSAVDQNLKALIINENKLIECLDKCIRV